MDVHGIAKRGVEQPCEDQGVNILRVWARGGQSDAPPMVSPTRSAMSSVANPSSAASGTMAMNDMMNVRVGDWSVK